MSMTDPIADMLTRVRNAVAAKLRTTDVPFSQVKFHVAEVLKREGFIADFQVVGEGKDRMMRVYLKYGRLGESAINEIERASKPGRRVYKDVTELTPVLRGIGIAIVSTSKGLMSDRECRKEHIGGEVLCTVW